MALRTLRALLTAQAQNHWNKIRHESQLTGLLATAGALALVVLVLVVPCLGMLWIGLEMGRELREASGPAPLLRWSGLQALFTVLFALLGSFRHRPAFTYAELGRFPIAPLELLLAEIPAGLFEVFPLLGAAGIAFSNLGLAVRMPGMAPLILLLTLQGLVAMLALLFIGASARRILSKRSSWALVAGLGGLAAVILMGWDGFRALLRDGIPALVPWLPGSQGYAGLAECSSGDALRGLTRVSAALAATLVLLMLAAWIHHRELATEARAGLRRGRSRLLRFRRPAGGIARLFQKQLLDSKAGRLTLISPLFFTFAFAFPLWVIRYGIERDHVLPDAVVRLSERAAEIPVFAIFFFLVVLLDSQIWMNQFGWDRAGIRTLLLLPIAPREILLGKALGIFRFAAMQSLIGVLPLLFVLTPSLSEVLTGVGIASSALLVAAGTGHVTSVRYPRAVARDGGADIPLHLSWIPTVLMLILTVALTIVVALAEQMGSWGPPVVLLALLAILAAGYAAALPALGDRVRRYRERLLSL